MRHLQDQSSVRRVNRALPFLFCAVAGLTTPACQQRPTTTTDTPAASTPDQPSPWLDRLRAGLSPGTPTADLPTWKADVESVAGQPQDLNNMAARESADGRYLSFVSYGKEPARVVVHDRQTRTDLPVPLPDAPLMEDRSIHFTAWAPSQNVLYILEDASDGLTRRAELRALPDGMGATFRDNGEAADWKDDKAAHEAAEAKRYEGRHQVLYRWRVGDRDARVLGRIEGWAVALDTGPDDVQLVYRPGVYWKPSKPLRYEWRSYDERGLRATAEVPFPTELDGRPLAFVHNYSQLVAEYKEFWIPANLYTQAEGRPFRRSQSTISRYRLDRPEAGWELVAYDVLRFRWSPDGERLFVQVRGVLPKQNNPFALCTVSRDRPQDLYRLDFDPLPHYVTVGHAAFAGTSANGQTLYLTATDRPIMTRDGKRPLDLHDHPGILQAYAHRLVGSP
ncbi:MAG: hypothetical protein AAF333_01670 [Planctomycetota bacterium]